MADFSIKQLLSKISEYDKLAKDSPNIDALVEYNLLGQYLNEKIDGKQAVKEENIIETCSVIKNYFNKVLKTETE